MQQPYYYPTYPSKLSNPLGLPGLSYSSELENPSSSLGILKLNPI